MTANNVETAFRLPSGVNEDFIRNILWKHHYQQQHQQENIKQQQRKQNIKQFTSPLPSPAMSETSSGNECGETEEDGFDQQNFEEGNSFISNSYFLLEQTRKKPGNSCKSLSTIQSYTSEAKSSLNVELFIELVRQFPVNWNSKVNCFKGHAKRKNGWNQINTALGGSFSSI